MKIFKIKINKNPNSAFIILFAVTLASIILSIALGIANVSFKEATFGTSAKDSNDAFLAADSGSECALSYDKLAGGVFPITGPAQSITCSGNTVTPTFSSNASSGTYDFSLSNIGNTGNSCAKVSVKKETSGSDPIKVTITSAGYNTSNCASISSNSNSRLIERKIAVSSYLGAPPAYTPSVAGVNLQCENNESCSFTAGSTGHWLNWFASPVGSVIGNCHASTESPFASWSTGTSTGEVGNITIGSLLAGSYTYKIACTNLQTSAEVSDQVVVNVSSPSVCDTSFPNDILRACYFDGTSAPTTTTAYLSQFTESTLTSPVGAWSGFTHDWGGGLVDSSGKSDSVSAVWRGSVNFQSGNYVFHVVADDGVQLTVDGANLITAWVDQGPTQYNSASVSLSGYKNVQMRWYENGGGAYSRLWWDYTPASCSITGGTITDVGGYRIHTFTSSGTFTVGCAKTVDYLIVGGGGSGASVVGTIGGGGGGGEVVSGTTALASGSSFTITSIGNGGTNGGAGGNTVAGGLTVRGGGGGGSGSNPVAGSGGSGAGGKSGHYGPYAGGSSTSVSPGVGRAGGSGNDYGAGGGGGAGDVGQTAWFTWPDSHGGNGGVGYTSSISGTSVVYGSGGGGAGGITYADGGEGTGGVSGNPSAGTAGKGASYANDGGVVNGNAANGYGNGGGGGASGNGSVSATGGAGSPGVVIIRYVYP